MKQTTNYQPRLKAQYFQSIRRQIMDELKLKNINQVPKIQYIILNIGLGRHKDDKKMIETATNTLAKITAQQPVDTHAKQSIAGFKLREGNKIGLKVTLRDQRMYEFLDRLINIVLPRLRDFHGVKIKAFDKSGNYSIGIADQSVFPELSFEETSTVHGLQVNIIIKSIEPQHSRILLEKFGMPFQKTAKEKK